MRRFTLLGALVALGLAAGAIAASVPKPVVVPRPSFGPAVGDVTASGPVRLVLVSQRRTPPTLHQFVAKSWLPRYQGASLVGAARRPGGEILIYGEDGLTARYVLGATTQKTIDYAFDFSRFWRSPGGGMVQQVTWAQQAGSTLYVETTHLGYADTSKGRNAYLTAVAIPSGRILWQTPGLVANARTFVVTGNLIVTGYGFTAERDYLYLLDRRTGRIRDRLAVPSAPEQIVLKDGRLQVRTYDHKLVVKLAPAS